MATQDLFKWRHFLPDVIMLNVRWYCRYSLSYRDLEEMMAERGVVVDHTTIFRWVQNDLIFGSTKTPKFGTGLTISFGT